MERPPAKQGDCRIQRDAKGDVISNGEPCWGPFKKIGSTFPMKQCKTCKRKS